VFIYVTVALFELGHRKLQKPLSLCFCKCSNFLSSMTLGPVKHHDISQSINQQINLGQVEF